MVTMMIPSRVWSVVSAVVFGILLLAKLLTSSKYKNLRLPPGPRGLPFIGSLHVLGKFPPRDFAKLAEIYGQLMSLWLGPRLVVVATSPAAVEEILKTWGSNFGIRIATSYSDVGSSSPAAVEEILKTWGSNFGIRIATSYSDVGSSSLDLGIKIQTHM